MYKKSYELTKFIHLIRDPHPDDNRDHSIHFVAWSYRFFARSINKILNVPHRKKSQGVKSEDLGGQGNKRETLELVMGSHLWSPYHQSLERSFGSTNILSAPMPHRHYTFTNVHDLSGFEPKPYGTAVCVTNHYSDLKVECVDAKWFFLENPGNGIKGFRFIFCRGVVAKKECSTACGISTAFIVLQGMKPALWLRAG
ncbi:hypothetical protein TNCV_1243161 [Trichonephila clavipes]|nr:hypothetical protein TNCV_1243161 [Trichonephila clavipes]